MVGDSWCNGFLGSLKLGGLGEQGGDLMDGGIYWGL